MSKEFSLTYIDEFGEEGTAYFITNEYHNLMELLFDKYFEDWGDCKGRAWCGTCHIQIIKGELPQPMDEEERHTLSKLFNSTENSRLACQIPVNESLNGLYIRILKDD